MAGESIDICICTFRRPSVVETLKSIAALDLPKDASIRVIVADNDTSPSAEASVRNAGAALGLAVAYIHAPAQNISVARNACLDAVQADWFAFIDDDEQAQPGWLKALLAARQGVDVVFGYVRAIYGHDAPAWMREADLHSTDFSKAPKWTSGYTCNVLVRRAAVAERGLRFDPALGTVGGEDSLFFTQLFGSGGRYAFTRAAVVDEPVPEARTRLAWLVRRRYRAGQTYAFLMKSQAPNAVWPVAAGSVLKALYSAALSGLTVWSPRMSAPNLMRAAFHVGVVAYSLGGRFYREYKSS